MSEGTQIPIRKLGQEPRWLVWSLRIAAYAIPLGFLLYVLYWNFLPFGYEKTFVIDVGSPGDTSGEFYLEPSRDLSERKTAPDGTTYRELNGIAYAVFKPKAVLKNAEITVSVEGEGVSIIPPVIDFDPDSVAWDYAWDFTKATDNKGRITFTQTNDNGLITDDDRQMAGVEGHLLSVISSVSSSSPPLVGTAFPFDGCMYFDGKSRLELPGSADLFESGPFTVYAEWMPEDNTKDFQQIVGHYNWELLQNKNSVSFQVGRMNDAQGPFYSVSYPITSNFFNQKHSALAIYSPAGQTSQNATSSQAITDNGHIDLFVDDNLASRSHFATSTIWRDYGNKNLSFGKSDHGVASNQMGCLAKAYVGRTDVITSMISGAFRTSQPEVRIAVEGETGAVWKSSTLHVY